MVFCNDCVKKEAVCCVLRGERCVWSGEAFLCVLLAARVLLPSLVGEISRGKSRMVSFWSFEMDTSDVTGSVQIKKEKLEEEGEFQQRDRACSHAIVSKGYYSNLVLHCYKMKWTHKSLYGSRD